MKRAVILGVLVLLASPAFAGQPLFYTRNDFWTLCPLATKPDYCRGMEQAFIDADREERANIIRGFVEAIEARKAEQAAQRAAQQAEQRNAELQRRLDLVIQQNNQVMQQNNRVMQQQPPVVIQQRSPLMGNTTNTTCNRVGDFMSCSSISQ